MSKFIFITGGVVSSLGKGIASSSIGALMQLWGYKVRLRKLDPYLNFDPGTMNPNQHGEVFVTDDGAETDLDLGHYERFTDINACKSDNTTTGQIYSNIIEKERCGKYLGGTVQVIPHVTDLIKQFCVTNTGDSDFIICEIGGTVGDIEALPFFEAIRQLAFDLGKENTIFIHLTLLPYLPSSNELKTKPTQHSVRELRSVGIQPDILLCRSIKSISLEERKKIALFANISEDKVIPALDVKSIFEVPVSYYENKCDIQILKHFNLPCKKKINIDKWKNIVAKDLNLDGKNTVQLAIVGKYIGLNDAYKSILEAIQHAGIRNEIDVKIRLINSRDLKKDTTDESLSEFFKDIDGILVPGGFGHDGIEGKIIAASYARRNKIPYFGICLGMHISIIEISRNVAMLNNANSSEFDEDNKHPVIALITEWSKDNNIIRRSKDSNLGGTMRLGAYPCLIQNNSKAYDIYKRNDIEERHRHRYEFNMNYKDILEKAGVLFSGVSPDKKLVEIMEIKDHPWFIGVQFHPEFKSRPFKPHPLFVSFTKALKKNSLTRNEQNL